MPPAANRSALADRLSTSRTADPQGARQGAQGRIEPYTNRALATHPPSGGELLGIRVPREVEDAGSLAFLTLLGGALLIALMIADEAGIGPRHEEWRARWAYRLIRH
jgi:hypothetical protein